MVRRRLGTTRSFTTAQWIAIVLPPILTGTMYLVFTRFTGNFGSDPGFLYAFLVYWIGWCLAVPAIILGPRELLDLIRDGTPSFGHRPKLTLFLLGWPLPAAFLFAFLPRVNQVTVPVIVVSLAVGVTIAVTENVLWRGLYVRLFPSDVRFGYVYPAVWFGLWHFAPQAVATNQFPGAPYSFVLYATALGFSYGYYAWTTNSIRWCTVSHAIHDSLGLSGITFVSLTTLLV